jgi:hypothetical protein
MKTTLSLTIICLSLCLVSLSCTSNTNNNQSNSNSGNAVSSSNSNGASEVRETSTLAGRRASSSKGREVSNDNSASYISVSVSSTRADRGVCGEITCTNVTRDRLDCIKKQARRYGLNIGDTPSGTISGPNYAGDYSWNAGTQTLTIHVTRKPDNVSCDQLLGICHVNMNICDLP